MEHWPCHLPTRVIDEDLPGEERAFMAAAKGLRLGDMLQLHIPDQRAALGRMHLRASTKRR